MQEKLLFEYAVIRVVPRVEREEFLNVGVILYCPKGKYLQSRITVDEKRLLAVAPELDMETLQGNLRAFERICSGAADGGPISRLDAAGRFRWLTAARSTVLQTSRVHPGLCADPVHALNRLHTQLVAG
jgi:hypothetical protein